MKIVVTCQPAVGHFHAVAPLALAAVRAGHEVVVVTGRGMGKWVRDAGFDAVETGPEWLAGRPRAGSFDNERRRLRLMSMGTAALLPGIVDALRTLGADLLVHESLEWAGPLAADVAGVPFASLGQLPRMPRALQAEALAPPWNSARERLGLPADPKLERLCPYLYLDAYLPSMQPLSEDPLLWFGSREEDAIAHPVRPPLWQAAAETLPDWLSEPDGRPLVYVTMGTAFNTEPELFATVANALRGGDFRVVLTVGKGVDPSGLDGDGVHAVEYLPQSQVLPKADAVVHHSGYLTTVGALAHGLPMVLLPVAVDQPYHAHRLSAAGAGIRLDARNLTAGLVRDAVEETLREPLYRANANRLRAELWSMPAEDEAVGLLEELGASGEPVRRAAG
ncbi:MULTISPECIES: glycosyltransferase [Amycolatopsis]|uniref:Glycosyltransferase n=2 Tax=Amycolatopsis TaxID=1813 RepID=A0ABW5I732_9PSEU